MSLPKSRVAYADCYDLLDQALESEKGIRIAVPDVEAAQSLRSRFHMARAINRDDNTHTYEKGHSLHGASVYDKLTLRIRQSGEQIYLYIEPTNKDIGEVEDLASIDDKAGPVEKNGDPAVLEAIVEGYRRRG